MTANLCRLPLNLIRNSLLLIIMDQDIEGSMESVKDFALDTTHTQGNKLLPTLPLFLSGKIYVPGDRGRGRRVFQASSVGCVLPRASTDLAHKFIINKCIEASRVSKRERERFRKRGTTNADIDVAF